MKIHCLYDKLVPLKDLKYHPKNRNKHSTEQIERLAKIIEYQGWRYPIKISKKSGFVTSGHGRAAAAIFLKYKTVPVNFQDYETEDQEYADVQSDNAIASWAELDMAGINSDLADFDPSFDLDLLGIKDFVLEPADKYADQDADNIPETKQNELGVKLGDLFQLGEHRLLCGDSTVLENVERLMDGKKADMVFTDPPYGMDLDTDYTKMPTSPNGARPLKHKKIIGDSEDFDPRFISIVQEMFDYCENMVLFGADYYAEHIKNKRAGSWYVWDKRVTENFDRMIGSAFELAWSKKKRKREICRCNNTLYSGETDAKNKVHPTQKPVKLIEWFFERMEGVIVADLFIGSGSTLIACEKTNRKCYGMEIDPHYCSVIIKRWETFSGKKAKKLTSNADKRAIKDKNGKGKKDGRQRLSVRA